MAGDITSFVKAIADYPRLQALVRKNRRAFSSLDIPIVLRILEYFEVDDEGFDSPHAVAVFASMVRQVLWRDAYREDEPPSPQGLAFAAALEGCFPGAADDPIQVRVLQSGHRRMDGYARAIAEYEKRVFMMKAADEAEALGLPEQPALSFVSPVMNRLREGVRARHLVELFGRDGDGDPSEPIRVMLRHFSGFEAKGSKEELEKCEKMRRRLKTLGLLDYDGKPDYVPPSQRRSLSADAVVDGLPVECMPAAVALAQDLATWREDNPEKSYMDFPLPEVIKHADMIEFNKVGVVVCYQQSMQVLDENGCEFEETVPYELVWGLSANAELILAEVAARPGLDTVEEENGPDLEELSAQIAEGVKQRNAIMAEERKGYRVAVAGCPYSEDIDLQVRWRDEKGELLAVRKYGVEVLNGKPSVTRNSPRNRRGYDWNSSSRLTQDEKEAAFAAVDADAVIAGSVDGIVTRTAWKAAGTALGAVFDWRRAEHAYEGQCQSMEALEAAAERLRAEIAQVNRRRKTDGGLPEEKVDSSLGVLRMRAVDGEKRLIEVTTSSSPSRRRVDGRLWLYSGEWLTVDESGSLVGNPRETFRSISKTEGLRILELAVKEYLERRPTAFDEAKLDKVLNDLSTAELDMRKLEDAETSAWNAMQQAFRHADEMRAALSSINKLAADRIPWIEPPEDPYDRMGSPYAAVDEDDGLDFT